MSRQATNGTADVVIYHNPACGTSCRTLALIEQAGIAPRIITYLQDPPARETFASLAKRIGVPVRALLREKEALYQTLGLGNASLGEDALLDVLAAHPILLNRPIVVTSRGARICRPAETVRDILPSTP